MRGQRSGSPRRPSRMRLRSGTKPESCALQRRQPGVGARSAAPRARRPQRPVAGGGRSAPARAAGAAGSASVACRRAGGRCWPGRPPMPLRQLSCWLRRRAAASAGCTLHSTACTMPPWPPGILGAARVGQARLRHHLRPGAGEEGQRLGRRAGGVGALAQLARDALGQQVALLGPQQRAHGALAAAAAARLRRRPRRRAAH